MAKRANFPHRKEARRETAKVRAAARAKLGDKGQLETLIKRGHENCKEVKKLRAKLCTNHGGIKGKNCWECGTPLA